MIENKLKKIIIVFLLPIFSLASEVFTPDAELDRALANAIQKIKYQHPKLNDYTISASVYLPIEHKKGSAVSGPIMTKANSAAVNHLFQIGSVTKTFTAVLVLKQVEQGNIDLHKTVGDYLPQTPDKWRLVTIAQLLNMTSGIPDYTENQSFMNNVMSNPKKKWRAKELLAEVADKPMLFEPGKSWEYSNTNYIILGLILAKQLSPKNNMDLDEALADHFKWLLNQSQLSDSYYMIKPVSEYPDVLKRHLLPGYNIGTFDEVAVNVSETNLSSAGAAGALITTTDDLAAWAYRLFFDEQTLSIQQRNQMKQLVCMDEEYKHCVLGKALSKSQKKAEGYGYGIMRLYNPKHGFIWYHTGQTLGFESVFAWLPRYNMSIAITVNVADDSSANEAFIMPALLTVINQLQTDEPISD